MKVETRTRRRRSRWPWPSGAAAALAVLVVGGASLGGCSTRNPAYCDRQTPCADPASTICDLTGAFGNKNSCVPAPADASAGQGRPDAATSGPCAGVDCSSLDDDCNIGVCDPDTGECVANPARETMTCGDGTVCDETTKICDAYPDTCALQTTGTENCQDFTCQAGSCVGGDPTPRDVECCRNEAVTHGLTCGSTDVSDCGACGGFSSTCDRSGTKSCTCVAHVCGGGTCGAASPTSCQRSCTRDTTGVPCAFDGQGLPRSCCSTTGSCNQACN